MKNKRLHIICAILFLLSCGLGYKIYKQQMELTDLKLIYSAEEGTRKQIEEKWAAMPQSYYTEDFLYYIPSFIPPSLAPLPIEEEPLMAPLLEHLLEIPSTMTARRKGNG